MHAGNQAVQTQVMTHRQQVEKRTPGGPAEVEQQPGGEQRERYAKSFFALRLTVPSMVQVCVAQAWALAGTPIPSAVNTGQRL